MKITKIYKCNDGQFMLSLVDDDHTHHNYCSKSLKTNVINLVCDIVTDSNFWYT